MDAELRAFRSFKKLSPTSIKPFETKAEIRSFKLVAAKIG